MTLTSNTARRWPFLGEVYRQGLSQWMSRQDVNGYAPYCVLTLDLSQSPSESPNLAKSVVIHKTPLSTSI